jgi:hypothetical protein
LDTPSTPLYPFGHGLSYTTFAYDSLELSATRARVSDPMVVRVRVRNSGTRAGDEVVQLYLRDEVASFTRPVRALRGFRRITLEPGEARTVSFTLGPADYALPGRISVRSSNRGSSRWESAPAQPSFNRPASSWCPESLAGRLKALDLSGTLPC